MENTISPNAFGKIAQSLAKNPLGIIALFIVMIYGFASLVTGLGDHLSFSERIPLIYFLVIFPILVLAVFTWLVSFHSQKLYGPGDFKNEENYIKMQMAAAASLSAATMKNPLENDSQTVPNIIDVVQSVNLGMHENKNSSYANHVLWVDDNPGNNIYERQAFEAVGIKFTLALSTEEALKKMRDERFAAIISDMGRQEGPREGYVLLDNLRNNGNNTPLFFYAASNAPQHKQETAEHGGQGCTNNPQELFEMVTRSIIRQR